VPAWIPFALGAPLAFLIGVAYLLGRRSYRRLQPGAAERARAELEIAGTYLRHMVDFTGLLREALTSSSIAGKIAGLEDLRELVFVAIAQGVKTLPGEYIRCALFEPAEERAERMLRTRHHHGHTARVEQLRLRMSSAAGHAFSTRAPIYLPDAGTNPMVQRTTGGRHPVETLLCVPAYGWETGRVDPIGVFSVTSNKAAAFSASDRKFIYACAEIIGLIGFFLRLFQFVERVSTRAPQAATEALDMETHATQELPQGDETG
jgi:GAF domain